MRSIRLVSDEAGLYLGWTVAGAGDLNRDGKPDIVVSSIDAPGTEDAMRGGGRVYLVYGGFDAAGDLRLSEVGRTIPGFVVQGAFGQAGNVLGDWLGHTLAAGGDINGDDFDDLLVSAAGTRGDRGAVYIIFGGSEIPSEISVADLGSWGAVVYGPQGRGQFGRSLVGLGDVDGDGFADFLAGAPNFDALGQGFAGRAYLVYGRAAWPDEGSVGEAGVRAFELRGPPRNAFGYEFGELGWAVAGAGDWNEDSFRDFLVTAHREAESFEPNVGHAYLVHGGPELPQSALDTGVGTDALPGLAIIGADSNVQLGSQAAGGGDFNGDGKLDFIVTSPSFFPQNPVKVEDSSVYIFFGGLAGKDGLGLHSIDPDYGSVKGGTAVRIHGRGFRGDEEVRFGGIPAVEVEVVTSVEIAARCPARPEAGKVDVEVRGGAETAQLAAAFEYTPPPRFEDITLDPGTLQGGPYRTLVIRDFAQDPRAPRIFRHFLNVSFGDLNGDGVDDLVIGAPTADGSLKQGTLSIIFGGKNLPEVIEEGQIGDHGTVLQGEETLFAFGFYLAVVSDVNGDGYNELAVGGALYRPLRDPFSPAGRSYLIFGRKDWPAEASLSAAIADGDALFWENARCGSVTVAGPGDVDGDGAPDLLLGNGNCGGAQGTVRIHSRGLAPGAMSPVPAVVIAGDPTPAPDPLGGEVTLRAFGSALSAAGDLNGDGHADIVVGARNNLGEVFLVLGAEAGFPAEISINNLIAAGRAVRIRKEVNQERLGTSLASAGDFNGDGLTDALVGGPGGGRYYHGETHLVFGSMGFGQGARDLDLLEQGSWGVLFPGEFPFDGSGSSVAGLGDINGDGLSDIGVIGIDLWNHQATAHVVFGGASSPAEMRLDRLRDRGFRIFGADAESWFSAGPEGGMAAGDLDGDGLRDLAIGERTAEGRRVVVLFGREQGGALFVRGEANGDGRVDISDAVSILGYLFLGVGTPRCLDALDAEDDGRTDITDAVYLLGHLFLGGPPPPSPFGEPGLDPSADSLSCGQG